ncbi:hypothetical protein LTR67_008442 [Exophiala xenobiotica]
MANLATTDPTASAEDWLVEFFNSVTRRPELLYDGTPRVKFGQSSGTGMPAQRPNSNELGDMFIHKHQPHELPHQQQSRTGDGDESNSHANNMAVKTVDISSKHATRSRVHAIDVATWASEPTKNPFKAKLRNLEQSQTYTEGPETLRSIEDHVGESGLEENSPLGSPQYPGPHSFNRDTEASPAPFVGNILEKVGHVLDSCLAAFTNLLKSPHFDKIILMCLMLALYFAIVGVFSGFRESWDAGVSWLATSSKWAFQKAGAVRNLTYAGAAPFLNTLMKSSKTLLSDVGVGSSAILRTSSSLGGSFLCSSTITMGVVQWLGFPCVRPTTRTIHDALNSTAFELGHLGSISELLIPHCNHFQLATISLSKQQKLLELSEVNFPNKAVAIALLSNYSQGLYDAGDEIYKVSLATDRIVRMMISNLDVAEEHLQFVLTTNPGWFRSWYKTYHVTRLLNQLLTTLDSQVVDLIEAIDECRQTIEDTHSKGIEFGLRMNTGRASINHQIGQQGFLSKFWNTNSPLHDMRDNLMTASFETGTILDMLYETKIRLSRHRNELLNAKTSMFFANSLSNTSGLQVIVTALHETVTQLSSTSANVELSRKREKDRKAKQWQEGLISL